MNYSDGGLSVTASEIEYWEIFRPNIYRYISEGKIWINPSTGQQMERCPWLKQLPNQDKYSCDIYYDRPDDCKYYPVTIEQMIKDECEMLETQDLVNSKTAQNFLDKLMEDSRPSVE